MQITVRTAQAVIKYLSRSIPKGRTEENELADLIELFQTVVDQRKRKT